MLLLLIGYIVSLYPTLNALNIFKLLFAVLTILYFGGAILLLILRRNKSNLLSQKSISLLIIGHLATLLVLSISAIYVDSHLIVTVFFITLYFVGGAYLPLFLKYKADLSTLILQDSSDQNLEGFCTKYDISSREKEIIYEICNGLSNQEVADKLFISLHTVKGHTSRIYMKTNIRSRAQLIAIVNTLRN
jgi:DNA-binding CsgD family transcriptional regulator